MSAEAAELRPANANTGRSACPISLQPKGWRSARYWLNGVGTRVLSISFGVAATVWAARSLGPGKLGVSTFAQSIAAQVAAIISMNADPGLVRRYVAIGDRDGRNEFVTAVVLSRIAIWAAAAIIGLVVAIVSHEPRAGIGAVALAFALTCPPLWLLQAQDAVMTQLHVTLLQQGLSCILIIALVRQGSSAGTDLLMSGLAAAIAAVVGWRIALRGAGLAIRVKHFRISVVKQIIMESRWLFATGVAINCYTRLAQPILSWRAGIHELGEYRTALQVGMAIASVTVLVPAFLYPRLIAWRRAGADVLWQNQKRIGTYASLISVGICLVAWPAIKLLFPLVFGNAYLAASTPACIVVVTQLVIVLNGIFCWGLWASGRDRELFALLTVTAVGNIAANIALDRHYGMIGASSISLASESIVLFGGVFLARRDAILAKQLRLYNE